MSNLFYLLKPEDNKRVIHALHSLCPRLNTNGLLAGWQVGLCLKGKLVRQGFDYRGIQELSANADLVRGSLKDVTCKNCIKSLKRARWL